jgi:hypothetical protein
MVIANRIIFVAIMDQTAFSKVECKNKKRKTSSKIFLERMGEDDSRDQLFNDLSNPGHRPPLRSRLYAAFCQPESGELAMPDNEFSHRPQKTPDI